MKLDLQHGRSHAKSLCRKLNRKTPESDLTALLQPFGQLERIHIG